MPRLVDTTIRVLSQEPLAGLMPTADLLRLAEVLDGAGFAYLEVSGGGVFDTAVRRGVESPWERIRALKARTRSTPLALAVRGRFLVGSRPVAVGIDGGVTRANIGRIAALEPDVIVAGSAVFSGNGAAAVVREMLGEIDRANGGEKGGNHG